MPVKIEIDDRLYDRIAALAERAGKTVDAYVDEVVREALRKRFAAEISADTEDLEINYPAPKSTPDGSG